MRPCVFLLPLSYPFWMSLRWLSCAFLCVAIVSSTPTFQHMPIRRINAPPLVYDVVVCIRFRYSE
jgi:hypothetical protein